MIFRNLFYSFSILLLLSFTVKADEFNRQDISTLTIEDIGRFKHVVFMKITTNSIIIPHGFCTDKQCPKDGQEIQYLGHHDIFKFVPEIYLTGSNFIRPIEYDGGWGGTKTEICFVNGRCLLRKYGKPYNEEVEVFNTLLNQILSGKSEYQFHPKTTSPMPKVIFDKKNLKSINLYQLIPYPFTEVLLYTITADSIIEHSVKRCALMNDKIRCGIKSANIQYQDKHNIFNSFPTLFLSGSNFIDPREYSRENNFRNPFKVNKIEACFADGHCNIWSTSVAESYNDDETRKFINKIKQFNSDITKIKINRIM